MSTNWKRPSTGTGGIKAWFGTVWGLLFVTALIATATSGPNRRIVGKPKPGLGEFAQVFTLAGTVSGMPFTWKGSITFSPNGSATTRRLSGTGLFTLGTAETLALASVAMVPTSVLGGAAATYTVTLNRAPLTAMQVTLQSSNLNVLTVPPTVSFNVGQTTASVAVTTKVVTALTMAAVTATYNGQSRAANLQVNPILIAPVPKIYAVTDRLGAAIPVQGLVVGSTINISGVGFGLQGTESRVSWGTYEFLKQSWTDTKIVATATAMGLAAPLAQPVTVQAAAGGKATSPSQLTLFPLVAPLPGQPLIQMIRALDGNPLTWPLVSGQKAKIVGTGFGTMGNKLWVNGYPTPFDTWADTQITFTLNDNSTRLYPGWVTVENANGNAYSGNFNKDGSGPVPEPPLFDAFYDDAGVKVTTAVEGTRLHLRGTHFGPRGMLIYSGWAVANVVAWTDTEIIFLAPFTWWDKRVSSVEVFPGATPGTPALSGRKGYWPSFTVTPKPNNQGPPPPLLPEGRKRGKG